MTAGGPMQRASTGRHVYLRRVHIHADIHADRHTCMQTPTHSCTYDLAISAARAQPGRGERAPEHAEERATSRCVRCSVRVLQGCMCFACVHMQRVRAEPMCEACVHVRRDFQQSLPRRGRGSMPRGPRPNRRWIAASASAARVAQRGARRGKQGMTCKYSAASAVSSSLPSPLGSARLMNATTLSSNVSSGAGPTVNSSMSSSYRRTHDPYQSIFLFRCIQVHILCMRTQSDRRTDRQSHTRAHTPL